MAPGTVGQAGHHAERGPGAGFAAVWRKKPFLLRLKHALLDLLGAENTRLRRELAALKAVVPRQRELTAELQRQRTELEAELAAQRAEVLACRQMFWQQRKLLAARLPAADPRKASRCCRGPVIRPWRPASASCSGWPPAPFRSGENCSTPVRGPSRAIPWTVAAWRGIAWPRNSAPL